MQERLFEFAAFIGIDWADRKHDVCLQVAGADTFEKSIIASGSASVFNGSARPQDLSTCVVYGEHVPEVHAFDVDKPAMQDGSSSTGWLPVQVTVRRLLVGSSPMVPMTFPAAFWRDIVTTPPTPTRGRRLPFIVKHVVVPFSILTDALNVPSMPMISFTPFE
jgi:hypothetical protein